MFVTEHFLSDIVAKYGEYLVSTAGGGILYPQAYHFLKLKHHIHSSNEKSIIERTMQYIKKIGLQNVLMIIFYAGKRNVN